MGIKIRDIILHRPNRGAVLCQITCIVLECAHPRGNIGRLLNSGLCQILRIVIEFAHIGRNHNVDSLIRTLVHSETIHRNAVLFNDNLAIVGCFGEIGFVQQIVITTCACYFRQIHCRTLCSIGGECLFRFAHFDRQRGIIHDWNVRTDGIRRINQSIVQCRTVGVLLRSQCRHIRINRCYRAG